jgi:hypothetical protein
MKLCFECERCRVATSLFKCKTAQEVVSRGDFYLWYHGDSGLRGVVPMVHVESDQWNSPLCWHHRQRPHDVTDHVFPEGGAASVGIYPDRETFRRVGEPMIKDAVRTALMKFEESDLECPPIKQRARPLPTISESWETD